MKLDYDISTDEMELIENYLGQNLSPGDAVLFNDKMKTDPNWPHKIEETKYLLIGLLESSVQNRLDEFHEKLPSSDKPQKSSVVPLRSRWMIAASLLIVFSVAAWLLFNNKNEFEKLYAGYYTPDPGLLTAMGPASNYSFEKGMVDYKNEEYEKALQGWSELEKQGQPGDTLQYFLGMANQALGRYETAKSYLENITKDSTHPFYSDACWYLGLLLLKQKNKQSAIFYIEKSNHPKKAGLLNALNKN